MREESREIVVLESKTWPERINFLCHFPVGSCFVIDPVAASSTRRRLSRWYYIARGYACATNCDRRHLDTRARSNTNRHGSNFENDICDLQIIRGITAVLRSLSTTSCLFRRVVDALSIANDRCEKYVR